MVLWEKTVVKKLVLIIVMHMVLAKTQHVSVIADLQENYANSVINIILSLNNIT